MRNSIVAVIVVCMLSACASSEDEADTARKRCTALRDHLIELRLDAAREIVDVDRHREVMRETLGDEFIDKCTSRPVNEVRCALTAKDTASVAECSPSN